MGTTFDFNKILKPMYKTEMISPSVPSRNDNEHTREYCNVEVASQEA